MNLLGSVEKHLVISVNMTPVRLPHELLISSSANGLSM